MNFDHHELRRAFERFLAARRALRQAYRKSVASHVSAEWMPMLESGASDQARAESVMNQELQELKDENARPRKSLALLHASSLTLREQRDTLVVQRDQLLDAYDAFVFGMRADHRAEEYSSSLRGQFDDIINKVGKHDSWSFPGDSLHRRVSDPSRTERTPSVGARPRRPLFAEKIKRIPLSKSGNFGSN